MLGKSTRLAFFAALVLVFLTAAGCGSKQVPDTKAATPPKLGIIDLDKAVKAHPKYADYLRLQRDYNSLVARIEAERAQAIGQAGPAASLAGKDGLMQAAQQEFNARMAAKEAETKAALAAAADQERQNANSELDAYGRELDKEYQPQMFNLQLRLKTVQLTKEEAAATEAELAKIKDEKAAKMAARQQELVAAMNTTMAAKQTKSQEELAAYAGTLNGEMADRVRKAQAEAAGRMTPPVSALGGADDSAREVAEKGRQAAAMRDAIIADIRDKTAKVAAEQNIDTVLNDIKINVSAADITAAVIAEFKK